MSDEFHETLKNYNFHPEKGIVHNEAGYYVWKKVRAESWQNPKPKRESNDSTQNQR